LGVNTSTFIAALINNVVAQGGLTEQSIALRLSVFALENVKNRHDFSSIPYTLPL
jgi:hypothetical protein